MKNQFLLVVISVVIIQTACSPPSTHQNSTDREVSEVDTAGMIRNFIYGLWSLDSSHSLFNEGYYFSQDGKVHPVGSEHPGFWELIGRDSIKFTFQFYSQKPVISYAHIDSLGADRMVLNSTERRMVLRKVPFGLEDQGQLLNGFNGSISTGEVREYNFQLPSAKRIQIKMQSPDPGVLFRVFDQNYELTDSGIRDWESILARGGTYRLSISRPGSKKDDEAVSFYIKVITF